MEKWIILAAAFGYAVSAFIDLTENLVSLCIIHALGAIVFAFAAAKFSL